MQPTETILSSSRNYRSFSNKVNNMKRKMIGAAAAYMSGSFFASFFTDARVWLITVGAVCMTLYFGAKRGWKRSDNILLAIAFTLGISMYSLYTSVCYKPAVLSICLSLCPPALCKGKKISSLGRKCSNRPMAPREMGKFSERKASWCEAGKGFPGLGALGSL